MDFTPPPIDVPKIARPRKEREVYTTDIGKDYQEIYKTVKKSKQLHKMKNDRKKQKYNKLYTDE